MIYFVTQLIEIASNNLIVYLNNTFRNIDLLSCHGALQR